MASASGTTNRASDGGILDKLDQILDDKDTFIIKLPNKFKDYLSRDFTLGSETATIGRITASRKRSNKMERKGGNPEQ